MAPQILLLTQLFMFIIMIGTADSLFTSTISTILFITALVMFCVCSIYISSNKKRLIRKQF